MSAPEDDRWPARIKSTLLRRAAILLVFPVLLVWFMWRDLLMLPVRLLWTLVIEVIDCLGEELGDVWRSPTARFLRIGFLWIWHADYHTGRDAALVEVKRKVNGR